MLFIALGWDAPDAKEKRPRQLASHIKYWSDWVAAGRVVIAGPMLDSAGSVMIMRAESREEVDRKMRDDPFVREGIFARSEVHPFRKTLPAADED